jgi:hypothetical protein
MGPARPDLAELSAAEVAMDQAVSAMNVAASAIEACRALLRDARGPEFRERCRIAFLSVRHSIIEQAAAAGWPKVSTREEVSGGEWRARSYASYTDDELRAIGLNAAALAASDGFIGTLAREFEQLSLLAGL